MDDQAQDMTNHTSKTNLTSKNKTSARTKKKGPAILEQQPLPAGLVFHSFAGPIGQETPSHHTQGHRQEQTNPIKKKKRRFLPSLD
jgi:hypothetical protein